MPSSHPNAELLTNFYSAFAARDHAAMAAAYAPDARFSDPVFPDLKGSEIGMMWRMLCERGTDLQVEFSGIDADDASGRAHWDATYTFSATGRKVLNHIDAEFRFENGQIVKHTDQFDLWAWTRQALGPTGLLLGWSPIVRNKIRGQAGGQLRRFIEKNG